MLKASFQILITFFSFSLFLTPVSWAQSIVGPEEGKPGETLTFRLMDGETQLPVDRWEQALNPDRYRGNDYVTSFTLQLAPQPDGSLVLTAPTPGRYKIVAWRGSNRWESYVLIRPAKVVPEIRGASFSAFEPLDREYASEVLAIAKRAGMTWADLVQTGFIDFDSGTLEVQSYCERCPGFMPVEDFEWLIDEAHRQGFKVSLDLGVWARKDGCLDELQSILEGVRLNPTPWPTCEGEPLPLTSMIPEVMQTYARFMVQMAELAQRHDVEAIIVGNNSSSPESNLLWDETKQWEDLFTRMRGVFAGKLWMGFEWSCPGQASFNNWKPLDGIHAGLSGDLASMPSCTFPLAGPNNPTAEELTKKISPELKSLRPFQLQKQTGLPVIYTDFYTVNVDGANFLGHLVYHLGDQAVQDNQEVVDIFEAAMRTVGQKKNVALFLWSVGLSRNWFGNIQDPLKQHALVNAMANWWGGDTDYFAPCLVSDPPDVLFQDDFDRDECPLEKQNLVMTLLNDWKTAKDPEEPVNTIIRGTHTNAAHIGKSSWTDYLVSLRIRLVGGPDSVAMVHFRVRQDDGWNAYTVHLGRNQVRLFKSVQSSSELLISYDVRGGTGLDRWYGLEIRAVGPTLTVKLDGELVIELTDSTDPGLEGSIALGVYGGPEGEPTADFDDIVVESLMPQTPPSLTVWKAGSGDGTVVSSPAGIDCGFTCYETYTSGTVVTLEPTPEGDSIFVRWSGGGCSGTGTCTVTLNEDTSVIATFITPLVMGSSTFPEGEVGVAYSAPLVSGGLLPYALRVTKGSLPPGLNLDSGGVITGVPTVAKSASFTVQVTDDAGTSVTKKFKIKVFKALGISTSGLKAGTVGKKYSATVKATGGKKPYTWSITSGSLPEGLLLDEATGKITGTPAAPGISDLTFQVTDPLGGVAEKTFTLTINP